MLTRARRAASPLAPRRPRPACSAPASACLAPDRPRRSAVVQATGDALHDQLRPQAQRPRRRSTRCGQLARAAAQKSADIIGCDEFSHEACGREFTYWMRHFGYLAAAAGGAAENIAWGTGSARDRALDLPAWLALARPPREHPRRLRRNRNRPARSARSKATAAPTSGPRTSAATSAEPRARPRMAACSTPSMSPTATNFLATELTRGPWDPGAQHAGPPSALLGRELERLPDAERLPGRPDHLRDPALGPDRARSRSSARIVRPGRRVQMIEAELRGGERGADAGPRLAAADRRGRPAAAGHLQADPARPGPEQGGDAELLPDRPGARLPHGDGDPLRLAAASSSWDRRPPGCGCGCRWSPARSRRRCSGCWSSPTSATGSAPRSTTAASSSSTSS